MPQLQPDLAFRALSVSLITLLAVVLVVFTLISMWKENRFGWPLGSIVWFYLVIVGSCAVIGLLAGYAQKARSIEKVTDRVEAVTLVGMKSTEVRIRLPKEPLVKVYVDIV